MSTSTTTITIEETNDEIIIPTQSEAYAAMIECRKTKTAHYLETILSNIKDYSGHGYSRCRYNGIDAEEHPDVITAVIKFLRKQGYSVVKTIESPTSIIIDWEYRED